MGPIHAHVRMWTPKRRSQVSHLFAGSDIVSPPSNYFAEEEAAHGKLVPMRSNGAIA
jgi:hypothetical protein